MKASEIIKRLEASDCVLTDSHFVYASWNHGTAYVNMRGVAHDTKFFVDVGAELASVIDEKYEPDIIIGPETLGRTLAFVTVLGLPVNIPAIWCSMIEGEGSEAKAQFLPKLGFDTMVQGKKVVIVDDLLTTGGSIKAVANLVAEFGGEVVAAAVVVRRSPDVGAFECGVPALEVLAEVEGFVTYSEEECAQVGPCSRRVPVVARLGRGMPWLRNNPGYPSV